MTVLDIFTNISLSNFIICILCSVFLGLIIACLHLYKNKCSKGFAITLALLPVIVQIVIMLVNGSVGTGIAIMGAFSLVRFRSVPGNAKDIASVFIAMTTGLATGTGYWLIAIIFVFVVEIMNFILTTLPFGEISNTARILKVTIPENLNYSDIFNDLFEEYTTKNQLVQIKTTNMGALFNLTYEIKLKNEASEKEFIDELRCRNGNLEISCNKPFINNTEL